MLAEVFLDFVNNLNHLYIYLKFYFLNYKILSKFIKDKNIDIVSAKDPISALLPILIKKLSNKEILKLNIPTGVPLVYEFDNNFKIINKEYLIDKKILRKKQSVVEKQGKVK